MTEIMEFYTGKVSWNKKTSTVTFNDGATTLPWLQVTLFDEIWKSMKAPLSNEELVYRIYGSSPTENAEAALATCLVRLRKSLQEIGLTIHKNTLARMTSPDEEAVIRAMNPVHRMPTMGMADMLTFSPTPSPWDDSSKLESLKTLAESGLSASEIAKEMGMTLDTVTSKAARIGIQLGGRGKAGRPSWSQEATEELKACVMRGLSKYQIAHKLNVSPDAVTSKANRLGLIMGSRGNVE